MKKDPLLRTNLLVCIVITVGFIATSVIGYRSNTSIFRQDAERVSSLASEGIYNGIDKLFSEPINVSLAMANDTLLKSFLTEEPQHLTDEAYTRKMGDYLGAYREKYGYDSVFLVSARTNRYYHFHGLDRLLVAGDPEDIWYYDFLESTEEYALNVDNDEADNNIITTFVNCKIKDATGATVGVIGVGLKVESLQALLKNYDDNFGVSACLVDAQGVVQISSVQTGYEHFNLFDTPGLADIRPLILSDLSQPQTVWASGDGTKRYVVSQYVPGLKWYLVVQNDMTALDHALQAQLYQGIVVILIIIVSVLVLITGMLKKYRVQIARFSVMQEREYQTLLSKATAAFYEDVFEMDVTHNRPVGESMDFYLAGLGLRKKLPLDESLREIAQRQIKEEYRQEFLNVFLPAHILQAYASGINNLSCDFMLSKNGSDYHWFRATAQIFYWPSDKSVRIIFYSQNIDVEKNRELLLLEKSQTDSMTGLYNKGVTEKSISAILESKAQPPVAHALLMFDIDAFKRINDQYGHAFGDTVIIEFAEELKRHFRGTDIIGRIGGDEFAVLLTHFDNITILQEKLERFCKRIAQKNFGQKKDTSITCSIGAALYPEHGATYSTLYEKADQALYYVKAHGKCAFHIMGEADYDSAAFHVDLLDFKAIIENTTDGIAKFACTQPMKLLYFNQSLLDLIGSSAQILSAEDFDPVAYVHPDDMPLLSDALTQAWTEKKAVAAIFRVRHSDGRYLKVKLHGFFVSERYQGKHPVFYTVYNDLSGMLPGEASGNAHPV